MYNILPSNKGVHSEAIFVGILYLWEYFISVNLIFVGAFYPQGLDYCLGCSYLIQLQLPLFPDFSNLASLPASLTPPLFDLSIHLNIISACLQNYKSKSKKLRNAIYCVDTSNDIFKRLSYSGHFFSIPPFESCTVVEKRSERKYGAEVIFCFSRERWLVHPYILLLLLIKILSQLAFAIFNGCVQWPIAENSKDADGSSL